MTNAREKEYADARNELLDAADAALAWLEDGSERSGSWRPDAVIADTQAFGRMVRAAKRVAASAAQRVAASGANEDENEDEEDPAADALVRAVSRAEQRRTLVSAKPPHRPGSNGDAPGLPAIDAARIEVAADWARHGIGDGDAPDLGNLLLGRYRSAADWRGDGINPVDAFVKHGFGDGEDEVLTDDVAAMLEAMTGWCAATVWRGSHNCVIVSLDAEQAFDDWRAVYQFDATGPAPDWERMPPRLQRALRQLGVKDGDDWRNRWFV